ncbi:hypothetical protein M5689_009016 [Euphorbia peplus]|nr:hypothetical protein M5689_009016 [Euphorbia peplus]
MLGCGCLFVQMLEFLVLQGDQLERHCQLLYMLVVSLPWQLLVWL